MAGKKRSLVRLEYYGVIMKHIHIAVEQYKVMVEGLQCEKFFSCIAESGIYIRNAAMFDDVTGIFMCSGHDFRKIEKIAGRNMCITVIEKKGIKPKLEKMFAGRGIIAGAVILTAFFVFQQFFITEIEIKGNVRVPEEQIRNAAADAGLEEFCMKPAFDSDDVETEIITEVDGISWVNITVRGSYVCIEVVESEKNAVPGGKGKSPVIAAKSGYIDEIIVKNGMKCVEEGDYVEKGQVIISPEVPVNNLTYDETRDNIVRHVDAEGIVKARVVYKLSGSCSAEKYSGKELDKAVNDEIYRFIRENIPDFIEIRNKDLKFKKEKNIIKCIVTIEVIEEIGLKKENEFAENRKRDD